MPSAWSKDAVGGSAAASDGALPSSRSRDAWSALGWLGFAFVVLGVLDIGLGIFPTAFGRPEWVFGTVSAILNGFAIPTMGAYLVLGAALASGGKARLMGIAAAMLVAACVILGLGLYFLTVVPVALDSVRASPEAMLGMKKAIAKAVMLDVAYAALLVIGALRAWTSANRLSA
jgi:hypothetical protein